MTDQLSMFTGNGHTLEAAPDLVEDRAATEPLPRLADPNPEIEIANDVKQSLARRRKVILDYLRQRLRRKYMDRVAAGWESPYVCADDARAILEGDERFPPKEQLNRNFLGALFLGKEWEPTGEQVKSKTPGSHANRLMCWRWVGPPV